MRRLLILILLVLSISAYSQFISGNVEVNSHSCDYTLTGNYYDSLNPSLSYSISFQYDSTLLSWKFVVPDSTNYIVSICAQSTNCNCQQVCQTSPISFGMNFQLELCLVFGLEKDYQISPNPFLNELNIVSKYDFNLYIYDYRGSLILNANNLKNIKTDSLPFGLYLIVITSNNKVFKLRLVKGN